MIEVLEFSRPVFNNGRNVTVRRGLKWVNKKTAKIFTGSGFEVVDLCSFSCEFSTLCDEDLKDEHDPSCTSYDGLLAEMKRIYPGFEDCEIVTVVSFDWKKRDSCVIL